jgi:hypothetical protein
MFEGGGQPISGACAAPANIASRHAACRQALAWPAWIPVATPVSGTA